VPEYPCCLQKNPHKKKKKKPVFEKGPCYTHVDALEALFKSYSFKKENLRSAMFQNFDQQVQEEMSVQ
jgi:hypothetical protein